MYCTTRHTVAVSFVMYVIACAWPSVTGFGTEVNERTIDWAVANAARPLAMRVLVNILFLTRRMSC